MRDELQREEKEKKEPRVPLKDIFEDWMRGNTPHDKKSTVHWKLTTDAGMQDLHRAMRHESFAFRYVELKRQAPEEQYENRLHFSKYGMKVHHEQELKLHPEKRHSRPASAASLHAEKMRRESLCIQAQTMRDLAKSLQRSQPGPRPKRNHHSEHHDRHSVHDRGSVHSASVQLQHADEDAIMQSPSGAALPTVRGAGAPQQGSRRPSVAATSAPALLSR